MIFNQLRKLPDKTWTLCFFLVSLLNGVAMLDPARGSKTFLCFNKGCVAIQGISLIMLGSVITLGEWWLTTRRHWRDWKYRGSVSPQRRRYRSHLRML
ncbi:MAG: hypothetical protein AAFN92_01940 [Bacteroidota bacterium]